MKENNRVWKKQVYIGAQILHSNVRSGNYRLIFAGAEPKGKEKWKINFILSYSSTIQNIAYSSTFYAIAKLGEQIRFEPYLGITEAITIESRPYDVVEYQHFYSVHFIKPIEIGNDFLLYEVHCI